MTKILFIVIILLVVLYTQANACEKAIVLEQRAIKHHDSKEYSIAAWEFKNAADIYKRKSIELYNKAASAHEQSAIKHQNSQEFSSAAWNCKNAADIYKQLDNKPKAIEMYNKAAELYNVSERNDTADKMLSIARKLQIQDHIAHSNNDQYHCKLFGFLSAILAIFIGYFISYLK